MNGVSVDRGEGLCVVACTYQYYSGLIGLIPDDFTFRITSFRSSIEMTCCFSLVILI